MKLTDANKLRDYVKEQINPYGKPFEGSAYEFGLKLIKYLENMSTDYDIDKVVDELEDRKKLHERLVDYETKNGTVTEKYQHIKAIDVLNKAIEIVNKGGVEKDVCEWKIDGDMAINPHNLSRYKIKQYDGLYMLDTCHHCRKKIKVVE